FMVIASCGRVLIANMAWYCCCVIPASRLMTSLAATNRRSATLIPASPWYFSGSSAMASVLRVLASGTVSDPDQLVKELSLSRLALHGPETIVYHAGI